MKFEDLIMNLVFSIIILHILLIIFGVYSAYNLFFLFCLFKIIFFLLCVVGIRLVWFYD
jgi:hypothetical protein